MIDTRARGQELQDQILAAARKGQQRVTSTVKNVTATAQMIRPQLPMPAINVVKLPSADQLAQLRDKQLSQLRERAPGLIAKFPTTEQLTETGRLLEGLARGRKTPLFCTGGSGLEYALTQWWREVGVLPSTPTAPNTSRFARLT